MRCDKADWQLSVLMRPKTRLRGRCNDGPPRWSTCGCGRRVGSRPVASGPGTTEGKSMHGAVMYAPGDVRVEERAEPKILAPSDAIVRLSASCICGSDLWPYRGIETFQWPSPMGHEYAGIVQQVGREVRTIEPGQFVVGSFFASDNTCEICRAGYHSSCINREPLGAEGAQAELLR